MQTMKTERLTLTRREFNENSCSTIRNLFEDKLFSDITILSEDGKEMKLHRAILASSSAFFRNILSRIKQSHPLIFLKGIQIKDLQAIVRFIYLGQAEVPQQDLTSFMDAAKCLQVSGLSVDSLALTSSDHQSASSSSDRPHVTKRVRFSLENNQNTIFEPIEQFIGDDFIEQEEKEQQVETRDIHTKEAQTKSEEMPDFQKNTTEMTTTETVKYSCDSCDQMYIRQDNLQRHLKIAHGQLLL